MKKSLIALLISTAFLTTACEDNVGAQKLLEAEKTIVQLESQLKTAQADLAKLQAELTAYQALKAENEKLKGEQAAQSFPTLNVEIVEVFNRKEIVKHEKDPKEEYAPESTEVTLITTIAKTGIDWLDELLPQASVSDEEAGFQRMLNDAKEIKPIALESVSTMEFIGQRQNIVTFSQFEHNYEGGAHGRYRTNYLVIDTDRKKIILTDDLIAPNNQTKLQQLLWETYANERLDEQGNYAGFADKADFFISDNFYFTRDGVAFVYPIYSLGPFVEGEVEIELDWQQINPLLNPAYQRTQNGSEAYH